ncbi:MAG: hypothetical protein XD95_0539 [Microgenomates bacterium 39_7]|nr:MAG: hypothetical protein XD95_0539 [Microgenomates bacterium 39_7]
MSKIQTPENLDELPLAIIKNIITLSTSGFGLVVALAWNELIRTAVSQYLIPIFGEGGGIISLLVYSLVVTVLAVIVTMELAKVQRKLEKQGQDELEQ